MAWIWVIPISWNNKSDLSGKDRYFRELANTFKSPWFLFFSLMVKLSLFSRLRNKEYSTRDCRDGSREHGWRSWFSNCVVKLLCYKFGTMVGQKPNFNLSSWARKRLEVWPWKWGSREIDDIMDFEVPSNCKGRDKKEQRQ